MGPSIKDYLISAAQLFNGQRTGAERMIAARRFEAVAPYLDLKQSLQILDLANGRLRPQYILLKSEGYEVYGIDLANQRNGFWEDAGYRLARWMFSRHVGLEKKATSDRLICGDVAHLPFADNRFDLITSVAAFEHFLDVPAVVAEMKRVLCSGGIAWIGIHPFTCLSGGHNVSFTEIPLRNIPKSVAAWDHLRDRNLPFSVPLNEWRISQYLDAFGQHFEILQHYCADAEGDHLLTPDIRAELAEYTREELTCLAYIIVARKCT